MTRDNTPLAVLVITFTVFLLTLGDAAIKGMSADITLWQIFVLRSAAALPVLLVIFASVARQTRIWPVQPVWVGLRSVMLAAMWVAYYACLPHLDLSVAAAAYYTLPIFITLFSALFVGEPVTRLGWIAVGLGFAGVLIILRPVSDAFSPVAFLPLLSAVLYAGAMILTRTKCRAEHPLVLSAALNVTFIAMGAGAMVILQTLPAGLVPGGFLSPDWATPQGTAWFALALMAVAILVGSIGTAVAYQIGRSSVVSIFDFTYVGFATLWGVVFFAERPDAYTLIGMAMIVLAGVLALRSAQ